MEAHSNPAERGLPPQRVRALRRALLLHYDARQRTLPWRKDNDPYRVWISEVMLQQTRVETALPYYERWLERFPTLEALAASPLDDVLHAWAGLGYYSRARNLHRAALVLRERHAGMFPSNAAALRELPGIGEYTASAVASIAFGEAVPAVDGNVKRVLSRVLNAELSAAELHHHARRLVPRERPGDFNQALMELGATICTPRSPRCPQCPLARLCAANAAGTQHELPRRKTRAATPEFHLLTLVVRTPRSVLLARSSHGLLARMWRFPSIPLEPTGDVASAARAAGREWLALTTSPASLDTITHAFSHRVEHYHVHVLRLPRQRAVRLEHYDEWRWVPIDQLEHHALPAAQRRIARLAL